MTRVYDLPEYAAFIRAMRAAPADAVAPLVCADWLEEHGKADHARFVRVCVELGRLTREQRAMRESGLRLESWAMGGAILDALSEAHALLDRRVHEWTGVRKFANPTPYDWPNGFLRTWGLVVSPANPHVDDRLAALLRRQPVHTVHLMLEPGRMRFAAAECARFSWLFRGVTFRCGDTFSFIAEEVPA